MIRAEVSAQKTIARRRSVAAARRINAGQVSADHGIAVDLALALPGITGAQVLVAHGTTADPTSTFPGVTTVGQVSALRGMAAMVQVLAHPGTTADQVSAHGAIAATGEV